MANEAADGPATDQLSSQIDGAAMPATEASAASRATTSGTSHGHDLIVLSRDLAAAAEQLDQVRSRLKSVSIGPAEQQTIQVRGADGDEDEGMALSDLMSWLEDFLRSRGPRLIAEHGRDGIEAAFTPTVGVMIGKVRALADSADRSWPQAISETRVSEGFRELQSRLEAILARIRDVTSEGTDHPTRLRDPRDQGHRHAR